MIKLLAAAGAAALLAGSANAAITSSTVSSTPAGETLVVTFDAPTAPGFTFSPSTPGSSSMSGVFSGNTAGIAVTPLGDSSNYFAAIAGGGVGTFTSMVPLTSLSLEIGSLDSYNTVSFFDGSTNVGTLTGTQIDPTANGSFSSYYNFTDTTGSFNKVVFSSTGNSLEMDNIAVSAAPEPATWALMFVGVGMVGGALRLRRRNGLAIAQA